MAGLTHQGVSKPDKAPDVNDFSGKYIQMIMLNYKVCSRILEGGEDSLREINEAIENLTERFPRALCDQYHYSDEDLPIHTLKRERRN